MSSLAKWQEDMYQYLNNLPERYHHILRSYVVGNELFRAMQQLLRGNKVKAAEEFPIEIASKVTKKVVIKVNSEAELQAVIKEFDQIFINSPPIPEDIILYRAQPIDTYMDFGYFDAKSGDVLNNPAYVSTATSGKVGGTFGVSQSALIVASDLPKYQANMPYVKSIKPFNDKSYLVELKNLCCFMRIFIPKGSKGLPVWLFRDNPNAHEDEILLPRNADFKFVKRTLEKVPPKDKTGLLYFEYKSPPQWLVPPTPFNILKINIKPKKIPAGLIIPIQKNGEPLKLAKPIKKPNVMVSVKNKPNKPMSKKKKTSKPNKKTSKPKKKISKPKKKISKPKKKTSKPKKKTSKPKKKTSKPKKKTSKPKKKTSKPKKKTSKPKKKISKPQKKTSKPKKTAPKKKYSKPKAHKKVSKGKKKY
jgi:hypothetical protein